MSTGAITLSKLRIEFDRWWWIWNLIPDHQFRLGAQNWKGLGLGLNGNSRGTRFIRGEKSSVDNGHNLPGVLALAQCTFHVILDDRRTPIGFFKPDESAWDSSQNERLRNEQRFFRFSDCLADCFFGKITSSIIIVNRPISNRWDTYCIALPRLILTRTNKNSFAVVQLPFHQ